MMKQQRMIVTAPVTSRPLGLSHVTVHPADGASPCAVFGDLADHVRARGERIVAQFVFGGAGNVRDGLRELERATGGVSVLLYPFYKDIIRARLVQDADGQVSLRDMDPQAGWLGDARSFHAAPAREHKGDTASASWLSSAYIAALWRMMNTSPAGRLTAADIVRVLPKE